MCLNSNARSVNVDKFRPPNPRIVKCHSRALTGPVKSRKCEFFTQREQAQPQKEHATSMLINRRFIVPNFAVVCFYFRFVAFRLHYAFFIFKKETTKRCKIGENTQFGQAIGFGKVTELLYRRFQIL